MTCSLGAKSVTMKFYFSYFYSKFRVIFDVQWNSPVKLKMTFIVKYSTGNSLNLHTNFILLVDNNGVFRSRLLRYCSHFFRALFSHSPGVKKKLIRIVGAATSKVF